MYIVRFNDETTCYKCDGKNEADGIVIDRNKDVIDEWCKDNDRNADEFDFAEKNEMISECGDESHLYKSRAIIKLVKSSELDESEKTLIIEMLNDDDINEFDCDDYDGLSDILYEADDF